MAIAPAASPETRKVLRALDYRGVELADSLHRRQLDEVRERFADLPNDALLHPFRVRKGLPAPGEALPGWYGDGIFNNIGQFFTLYARVYAATGDKRFADKATELFHGWAETVDDDGYFLDSPVPKFSKEYTYDKIVCGLLDIHQYVGVDTLAVLRRITEWMKAHAYTAKGYANGIHSLEWYTLGEYLLRAWTVTADPLYLELADVYIYDEFFDVVRTGDVDAVMEKAREVRLTYQAHSHLNSLNSAAAVYEVTGDRKYLDTIVAGHDLICESQSYATGMFGPLEEFVVPRQRTEVLHTEAGHAEIPCPSWAMNRFVRHLVELTGEARFGDWMELNFYNGIGAAPTTDPQGRPLQYCADYGFDGASKQWGLQWSCCSTTGPISVAEHVNQVYYVGPDALHVCLYTPSSVRCTIDGAELSLTQRTRFPVEDTVSFEVALERAATGALRFRVPGWLTTTPAFTVNGEGYDPPVELGWATIERTWHDGDVVTLTLPMELAAVPVEPAFYEAPVAVRCGPVVLVVPQADGTPAPSASDIRAVVASATRDGADELTFTGRAADGRVVRLVPYYSVPPESPYAMHFDDDDDGRIHWPELRYEPADQWREVDNQQVPEFAVAPPRRYMASTVGGASFSVAFEGTGVVWCGYHSPEAGWADVYLDGQLVERITQAATWNLQPWLWSIDGLAPGRHELSVVAVDGEGPSLRRGTELNVHHVRGLR
ncbi:MAG: glycoside hydrolase family 127 protein [Actinobacteria bacterium]|nr:glycoside hydrolase family 127 protein [Actinomycetota bacterium]